MEEEPELAKARQEFYEAQNLFHREPSTETRDAYKRASSTFNTALDKFGKSGQLNDKRQSLAEAGITTTISDEDAMLIDALREAQNAAHREMYANPSEQTKAKWYAAKNEYKKIRRKLDPEFAAKLSSSTQRSVAKREGKSLRSAG